ncbi:MAG: hypothetical protein JO295_07480 [Verrucomicrobia bacterium]|nr:hypothetical protein [Verrucomicrobiota bacterium]
MAASSSSPLTPGAIFRTRAAALTLTQALIRAFYCFDLFLTATRFPDFVHPGKVPPPEFLLWPVAWLAWVPARLGFAVLFILQIGGALAGAAACQWRIARLLAALGLLEWAALENSVFKIGHTLHLLVFVAGLLVFLPRGWDGPAGAVRRSVRERTLLVFWTCQAVVMLSYTLSGLGKFGGAFYQLAHGQPTVFSPDALALHVAERLAQTDSTSLLGSWLLAHPWTGWPLMLSAIYLQTFAFWIAFRPALQRFWAVGLIGFHIGSFFLMTINFPQNSFLLALFFFRSPFADEAWPRLRQFLSDLPVFGAIASRFLPEQSAAKRRGDAPVIPLELPAR